MRYERVDATIGNTPSVRVVHAASPTRRLYMKLEGTNPTGSIKDRTCQYLLNAALDNGDLRPGMTLLDASSGNLACALAYLGRQRGFPTTVVVSTKLTQPKRDFLTLFEAEIRSHGNFTIEGNQLCRQLVSESPGKYCFLDQLHNWGNPQAHRETTGPEILAEFADLGAVVGSLGSGGALLGVADCIKQQRPEVAIVAVQSASGSRIPGVATLADGDYVTPFIRRGFDAGMFDRAIEINETQAYRRSAELRAAGIFCGMQAGALLEAALQLGSALPVGDIVMIAGDAGWKNTDKLLAFQAADRPTLSQ